MHIVFVHTPMSTWSVPERRAYWRNFDIRYHAAHPGLRHMRNSRWELPHWMPWLGGVLADAGFTSLEALDLGVSQPVHDSIDGPRARAALREHPADVYLFSPMAPNLHVAYEIADLVKELYPESIVVFGGVAATPLHEQVAAHRSVDYVVCGRAEYALPALLKATRGEGEIASVGNVSYRTPGESVRTNALRYPPMPVRDIPFPKVDLLPPSVGEDVRYIRQVYALGCPYHCSFCSTQTIGRKPDYFPIDRVLSEITAYRARYGEHHHIYWGDETFTANPGRTLKLCHALEEAGNVHYDCQTRLNCLSEPQLIAALRRSGCLWLELGLETSLQGSHDLHKQRLKLSPARDVLARLRDAGIATCSFMVNGFPTETVDDMKRSVEWVCSLIQSGLLQASYLSGLVPYPGSRMYANPDQYSMTLLHHDYRLYHEEMPPVFASTRAEPDSVYQQFLDGLRDLTQAMGGKPYFGERPPESELDAYGAFWSGSHI